MLPPSLTRRRLLPRGESVPDVEARSALQGIFQVVFSGNLVRFSKEVRSKRSSSRLGGHFTLLIEIDCSVISAFSFSCYVSFRATSLRPISGVGWSEWARSSWRGTGPFMRLTTPLRCLSRFSAAFLDRSFLDRSGAASYRRGGDVFKGDVLTRGLSPTPNRRFQTSYTADKRVDIAFSARTVCW